MQNVFAETLVAAPLRVTLFWSGPKLKRILLRWQDDPFEPGEQGVDKGLCSSGFADAMQKALDAYVAGEHVVWPQLPLDMEPLTPFSRLALETLHREVQWGRTVSYGELAAICGKPGAARSIGRAMALNPWPLVVPCHRVVGARGDLVGFSGTGVSMKRYLLDKEGALPAKASQK